MRGLRSLQATEVPAWLDFGQWSLAFPNLFLAPACCGYAMAINNVSYKGRRIYRGRRKEGGRCTNGKTGQLEPIELRIVAAQGASASSPRAPNRLHP
jgi:hypothetical protein